MRVAAWNTLTDSGLIKTICFTSDIFCCVFKYSFFFGPYSQFMDDNDDGESQKFLSNGMMKKKKYEEYHEEYVSGFTSHSANVVSVCQNTTKLQKKVLIAVKAVNS